MTEQLDWVGDIPQARRNFKDIRNTKDAVAEEKARLVLELGELCKRIPPNIAGGGSVDMVRDWRRTRLDALKVAGNKRASVHELRSAISAMGRHFK